MGGQTPARDNFRGALLMLGAIFIFTVESSIVRWLGPDVAAVHIVLCRAVGQFIVVFVWAAHRGAWPNLRSNRLRVHIARGLSSIFSWYAYYVTFQVLPVALATLLTYATSLFVVVLAGPVLGETVRRSTWIATIAGFAGIAIASGVGIDTFDPYIIVGIFSAAMSAVLVFLTRSLAQSEDTITIMAWIGFIVLPAAIAAALWSGQPLSWQTALVLLATGTLGAAGMVIMIGAYAIAEAAVLAPIPYVRMAFAIVIGYLFFAETPTPTTLIGTFIVIAAALYALRAERR